MGNGYTGDSAEEMNAAYDERTSVTIEIDGRLHRMSLPLSLIGAGPSPQAGQSAAAGQAGMSEVASNKNEDGTAVPCPYTGVLVNWRVEDGEQVEAGQAIATVEAMKMESAVEAPVAGIVTRADIQVGGNLNQGDTLATIAEA